MKTNGNVRPIRRTGNGHEPASPQLAQLARCIAAYAPHDGRFEMRIPGLLVSRHTRINTECIHTFQVPSLGIIAQGAKTVIVGKDVFQYDASRMLVFSVALPVAAQITEASHAHPFFGLRLDLDPLKINELLFKVFPGGLPSVHERKAVDVTPIDPHILNALIRLFECLAHPGESELLAPLIKDEILIRLLRGPLGPASPRWD